MQALMAETAAVSTTKFSRWGAKGTPSLSKICTNGLAEPSMDCQDISDMMTTMVPT